MWSYAATVLYPAQALKRAGVSIGAGAIGDETTGLPRRGLGPHFSRRYDRPILLAHETEHDQIVEESLPESGPSGPPPGRGRQALHGRHAAVPRHARAACTQARWTPRRRSLGRLPHLSPHLRDDAPTGRLEREAGPNHSRASLARMHACDPTALPRRRPAGHVLPRRLREVGVCPGCDQLRPLCDRWAPIDAASMAPKPRLGTMFARPRA
jgi:hypothetical protein